MNLRDLEYLVALDEEQHFHRAAARCFVSQPTLSGQIKKLEEYLGVMLVERGRQVRMTEAGKLVAAQARRVLTEARGVKEIATTFRDPMAGRLQLGVIPTIAPYLLPLFVPRLHKRHPRLQLFLHEHQTAVLLDKLRNGDLDLLLLALPVETDEFAEINLYQEPFLLSVPTGHASLAKVKVAGLDHLHGQEVLLLEEGHCLRGQALDVCLLGGASEYSGFRGTSLETVRQMVAEGIGITLMPQLAQGREKTIRYIPFADPVPTRRVGLLYRSGSYRTEAFAAVAQAVREAVMPVLGERWIVDQP
ncbi:MAG: DNA-binding transcriptional regulator OxyR [Thiohalomonadaceae bacterium]